MNTDLPPPWVERVYDSVMRCVRCGREFAASDINWAGYAGSHDAGRRNNLNRARAQRHTNQCPGYETVRLTPAQCGAVLKLMQTSETIWDDPECDALGDTLHGAYAAGTGATVKADVLRSAFTVESDPDGWPAAVLRSLNAAARKVGCERRR